MSFNFIRGQRLDINLLNEISRRPELFAKGTDSMWDDPHISRHMLSAHLDPGSDAASRKISIINHTVTWLAKQFSKSKADILDLGCGPGLYAKKLASLGHNVVGMDFSKRSIEFATADAAKENLKIEYIYKNYLTMDFDARFDVILLIYCDFGVLSNTERDELLKRVHKALRPGGMFIFDVFNEKCSCSKIIQKGLSIEKDGFWAEGQYLNLFETFLYPDDRAFVDQYVVIGETGDIKVYRAWNHYYSKDEIGEVLGRFNFSKHRYYDNVIESSNFTSTDVTFIVTYKA